MPPRRQRGGTHRGVGGAVPGKPGREPPVRPADGLFRCHRGGNVEELIEALEVRFLANRDENLQFGLLTDFSDATEEATWRNSSRRWRCGSWQTGTRTSSSAC